MCWNRLKERMRHFEKVNFCSAAGRGNENGRNFKIKLSQVKWNEGMIKFEDSVTNFQVS